MAGSHIFICFSSKDEAVAREVVEALEAGGLKCWISLRDVLAGQNYQEAIVAALEAASGIAFLFSEHSNRSLEIKKELSIGDSINVPVFPLRLSPIAPSGALRYELAIRQWIDIFPHREQALAKLAQTIKSALDGSAAVDGRAPGDLRPDARPMTVARTPATARRPGPGRKAPALAPRAPIIAPHSRQFETIRTLLAHHIGPIAKVLVEKAASEALNADEFCEKLATHVPSSGDRKSFVRAVREQLAAKS